MKIIIGTDKEDMAIRAACAAAEKIRRAIVENGADTGIMSSGAMSGSKNLIDKKENRIKGT